MFILDESFVDFSIGFEDNTFVNNKHSFNQLQKWFINDDKKLIIVYKNYFTGDTIEEITDIL